MAKYIKNKIQRVHKGRIRGVEHKKLFLSQGKIGIKSLENGRLTSKQIEMVRRLINRRLKYLKKRIKRKSFGKLWINLNCKYPLTKKPLQVRMGKGKGPIQKYICRIKTGRVLLELTGNLKDIILKKILDKVRTKFPVKTEVISL